MTLSVVIPTYNRAYMLEKNLQALSKQTDSHFDVLVIDGGSTDKTLNILKKFQKKLQLKIIIDKTHHLSYIRNRLWQESTGEIVAAIDDDTIVSSNWVKSIKHLLQDPKIGGVTGPTIIPHVLLKKRDVFLFHSAKNSFVKFVGFLYFFLFMNGEKYEIGRVYPSGAWSPGSNFPSSLKLKGPVKVDYLEACNFAIKKSVLKIIGGFDTKFTGTSEGCEADVSYRIRKAGYTLLFSPLLKTEHRVSRSGVFERRFNGPERLRNFVQFYLKSYFPKTIKGYTQFSLYMLFLTFYFSYIGIRTKFTLRHETTY